MSIDCTTDGGSNWSPQKRTDSLSNGEIIWDLGGNLWEWIDWNVTPANKACVGGVPVTAFIEFNTLNTNISPGDDMETVTWQAANTLLDGVINGIGQYYADTFVVGGAASRGITTLQVKLWPEFTH